MSLNAFGVRALTTRFDYSISPNLKRQEAD